MKTWQHGNMCNCVSTSGQRKVCSLPPHEILHHKLSLYIIDTSVLRSIKFRSTPIQQHFKVLRITEVAFICSDNTKPSHPTGPTRSASVVIGGPSRARYFASAPFQRRPLSSRRFDGETSDTRLTIHLTNVLK